MIGMRKQSKISLSFERKRDRVWKRTALLALAFSYFAGSVGAGQRELNLHRSLYVPVRFIAYQHVKNVRMSVRGDETVFPLGLRTFLFTYDVNRKEVIPQFVDVRIEGEGLDTGIPFSTNVIITPDGARSSVDSSQVDLESVEKQARVRRDIRFPLQHVRITANSDCEKKATTVADSTDRLENAEEGTQTSR